MDRFLLLSFETICNGVPICRTHPDPVHATTDSDLTGATLYHTHPGRVDVVFSVLARAFHGRPASCGVS